VWYHEHNLGAGQLLDDIQRELRTRPVFVFVLSKAALASESVVQQCDRASTLCSREPSRILLAVVASPINLNDFDGLPFLGGFTCVEGPGHQPYLQDEAIERTLRLLALTPETPEPGESADGLVVYGKAMVARAQYAGAIPFFEQATQLAPDSRSAWANLGVTQGKLERWQETLAACDRALALDLTLVPGWHNQATTLYYLKRYREALAAYEQALVLQPTHAYAWTGRGLTLCKLQRYEEAVAAYDRALGRKAEARDAERRAWALRG
jgi:tetratricopeptide (TPR) repeat protein